MIGLSKGRGDSGVGRLVKLNLITALAYLVTALFGLWLSDVAGIASPIWPPAGVALAAVLLSGRSVSFGILVGGVCANLFATFSALGTLSSLSVLVAFGVGLGAVLQAGVSARLVRRFTVMPSPLEDIESIASLIFFGGVVGCLVNTTTSNLLLLSVGFLDPSEWVFSWLTWWVGDAMGVSVLTPSIVLLCYHGVRTNPVRKMILAGSLISIFAVVTLIFLLARESERRDATNQFDTECSEMVHLFQSRTEVYREMMLATERFIAARSGHLSYQEFCFFTDVLLRNKPEIAAIGWNPRVLKEDRDAFETYIRSQGFPDFQITQRDFDGSPVRAGDHAVHVPVAYLQPFEGNSRAHGHDTYASDPIDGHGRREALDAARDLGEDRATERIGVVQDRGHRNAVLVFHPVFRDEAWERARDANDPELLGYVGLVIFVRDVIDQIMGSYLAAGKGLVLTDDSGLLHERLLYTSFSDEQRGEVTFPRLRKGQHHYARTIKFAGRNWTFSLFETKEAFYGRQQWLSWSILFAGFLFAVLLSILLLVLTGHTAHTQRLIEQRTRELVKTRAEVVKNEKLASLGLLSAGISHEINNPLAIIHAYAEDLGRCCDRNHFDPSRIRKTSDTVLATTKRISAIIDGLKRYSRDESHEPRYLVRVGTLVEHTLALCREKFKNQGIALKIRCEAEEESIRCRETEISQVLINLLNNAFQEVIALDEKWVSLFVKKADNMVEFRITDSGAGIDSTICGRIFDPFFTTKAAGEGTGLGLSISAGIVDAHGGKIWVDAEDPNTAFVFSLPVFDASMELDSDQT